MIVKLSDFLRYSISQQDTGLSDLLSEMNNTRRYLDIEQVRFGNKLKQEFDIPDNCSGIRVPTMILQPIFENAVKHGVYESTESIIIRTVCRLQNDFLNIIISNNYDPQSIPRKGAGIGLKNIRERLKLIYGSEQLIDTENKDNVFTVKMMIPLIST